MTNTAPQQVPERRTTPDTQAQRAHSRSARPARRAPFLRLLLFYAVIVGVAMAALEYVPYLRDLWSGEIRAAGRVMELLGRPIIAEFLADKGEELEDLAVRSFLRFGRSGFAFR